VCVCLGVHVYVYVKVQVIQQRIQIKIVLISHMSIIPRCLTAHFFLMRRHNYARLTGREGEKGLSMRLAGDVCWGNKLSEKLTESSRL
jgi:hypothetical protein